MSEQVAIKVDNVSKDFRLVHEKNTTLKSKFTSLIKGKGSGRSATKQHALKDISFEVKKGEFFGIVGRNGSGKSTLLKILAEIYQPTKGNVHVSGKLVPFIELGVGFNPELTGRENVYLNGAILGFSKKEIDGFYDEVVEFAELNEYMDKKLKNYSSGMQVRLAFSMAIRADADILLIDEVLAVGDADFQRKCFKYFKQLKKNENTVIIVTHDMDAISEYCDRAAIIESSHLAKIGKPEEITKEYVKLFAKESNVVSKGNRWGDGTAKTESVRTNITPEQIRITQIIVGTVETSRDKQYAIGIRLRSADGKGITGTNSKLEGKTIENLKKNARKTIQWTIPNVLSDGNYIIDLAVQDEDTITTHDWWDEAAILSISKKRKLPYSIDPGFKLEIN